MTDDQQDTIAANLRKAHGNLAPEQTQNALTLAMATRQIAAQKLLERVTMLVTVLMVLGVVTWLHWAGVVTW